MTSEARATVQGASLPAPAGQPTARAHEFNKVHDWVVIYFHSDSGGEGAADSRHRDTRSFRRTTRRAWA